MKVILKDVRLAFPQIWTPKPFPGQKDAVPKFNCTLLFPKDHPAFKDVMDAIVEVTKEARPKDWEEFLTSIKGNSNKYCFIDGNTKKTVEGYEGNYALSAGNKTRPAIKSNVKGPDGKFVDTVESDGLIYGGCQVHAILDIWCQVKTYPGVRCRLDGLQFCRDNDHFAGGGVASEDDFGDLSDGADAPDIGGATGTGGGFV